MYYFLKTLFSEKTHSKKNKRRGIVVKIIIYFYFLARAHILNKLEVVKTHRLSQHSKYQHKFLNIYMSQICLGSVSIFGCQSWWSVHVCKINLLLYNLDSSRKYPLPFFSSLHPPHPTPSPLLSLPILPNEEETSSSPKFAVRGLDILSSTPIMLSFFSFIFQRFTRKEDVMRHYNWHRRRDDSLQHGFMRFSPSDDCSPHYPGCALNFRNTHYHCMQVSVRCVTSSTITKGIHLPLLSLPLPFPFPCPFPPLPIPSLWHIFSLFPLTP